jgi:hypothetical protein
MPDDLLRYLSGPGPYSSWWLVVGQVILAAVIAWYAGVLVWTQSPERLRRIPLIRSLHAGLLRRRFAHSIRTARNDYQAGELSAAQAAAAMRRTLRSFLSLQTGSRTQFMHVGDMAASRNLAPAAPVLSALNEAQFNTTSDAELIRIGHEAEELIRSWS